MHVFVTTLSEQETKVRIKILGEDKKCKAMENTSLLYHYIVAMNLVQFLRASITKFSGGCRHSSGPPRLNSPLKLCSAIPEVCNQVPILTVHSQQAAIIFFLRWKKWPIIIPVFFTFAMLWSSFSSLLYIGRDSLSSFLKPSQMQWKPCSLSNFQIVHEILMTKEGQYLQNKKDNVKFSYCIDEQTLRKKKRKIFYGKG